jgi:8-oxo-dGTP pyrophosphatase MutT (NUDIX family)
MRSRAAAIIVRDQTVLLIHRQKPGKDFYILPGGGVELDETIEGACIREVKEETGYDVIHLQLIQVYHTQQGQEYYFRVQVPPGEPRLGGPEALEQSPENSYIFEWVPASKLAGVDFKPPFARQMCLDLLV